MKIIIFEGITTSGKTSVIEKMAKILDKQKISYSVISEDKTLMPLLDNTDKNKSIEFLKQTIKQSINKEKEIIIFDRLFFTHIFRTNSTIKDFKEIEDLIKNNAAIFFLKINENKIPERIKNAQKHRDKYWNEYVSKKGSEKEINDYYANQQQLLLNLVQNSTLNCQVYDATAMDFDRIAANILTKNTVPK